MIRIICFLILFVGKAFTQDVKPKKIEVVIGQDKVINLDFAPYTKVEIGNDAILTYKIAPKDALP